MTSARKKRHIDAGSLSTHNGFSLISDEKLLELYATMLKCRMLRESLRAQAGGNGNGTAGAANENVAVIAGVLVDLQLRDSLAPSQGGLVPCFAKGVPLAAVLARAVGASIPGRSSYGALNVISPAFRFAAQVDRTIAAVEKENRGRDKRAAVIFCEDWDASAKEFESAMKLARRKKLPLVFVCWSGLAEAGVAERAQACGLAGVAVDGNDAVAIYRVATEAIAHARRGSGPTVIDCKPWPARRRNVRHAANDPIRNMESYLGKKKLFSRKFKAQVISDFKRELDEVARQIFR